MLQGGPLLNVTHINKKHWTFNRISAFFTKKITIECIITQSHELTARASWHRWVKTNTIIQPISLIKDKPLYIAKIYYTNNNKPQ